MSVRVNVSSLLLKHTTGRKIVEVDCGNPLECLGGLVSEFPKLKKWLYDKDGELRPQIWLFVNGERIFTDDLTRRLNDNDELSILLAISGG